MIKRGRGWRGGGGAERCSEGEKKGTARQKRKEDIGKESLRC